MKQQKNIPYIAIALIGISVGVFFRTTAGAQTLTGTVTDSATGTPIKNATVTLKTAGKATLTDEQGRFSFSENTVSRSFPQSWNAAGMVELLNQRLKFNIAENATPVSITMHDLSGRLLQTLANGIYAKGDYSITVSAKKSFHAGIVLVHCRIGEAKQTIRLLLPPCHTVTLSLSPSVTPSPRLSLSSSTDTLITDRYGYFSDIRSTSASTQNLAIRLRKMPENAIVPPGMKLVNGDVFIMGSQNWLPQETPEHLVSVSSFFMDSTEVTQLDFGLLMKNRQAQKPRYPITNITWFDAILYCNERSKRDGLDTVYTYKRITGTPGDSCIADSVLVDFQKIGYRLSTEAEREFACGNGASTTYYWGANSDSAVNYEWFNGNSGDTIHPVAQKKPNMVGLYDMTGNVMEWVNDWEAQYSAEEQIDPIGPVIGPMRVVRSSHKGFAATTLRITLRTSFLPNRRDYVTGFRAALPKR